MNLTKEQKKERSAKLADELKSSGGIFFAAYQGLKFQDLAALRDKLSAAKCRFRVERNSVAGHALKGAGIPDAPGSEVLQGPTAIAIAKEEGDIVSAAKILAAFEKDFPALRLKAGYTPTTWFSVNECKRLATLGTRTEMLSKLAGGLYGCMSRTASVLQAPMRSLAYALKAVETKKKEGAAAA